MSYIFDTAFYDLSEKELHFSRDFTPEEFAERRQRIAAEVPADAKILIPSAPVNGGLTHLQDANFYYFCGLEICQAYLLIDGQSGKSSLFLSSRNVMHIADEGRLGFEEADYIRERQKLDVVEPVDKLTDALAGSKEIYMPFAEAEGAGTCRWDGNGCYKTREADPWDLYEARHKKIIRLLKERVPGVEVHDCCLMIDKMRVIKSPAEIEVMRKGAQVNVNAFKEVMRATRPGVTESRLQAVAEFVFRDQGHCSASYAYIIAAGTNTWDGHYHKNNSTTKDDDLLLVDFGVDYRHYACDMTRCWPVNGTYNEWQRDIYGFIVAYHRILLNEIKAGVMAKDVYINANNAMAEKLKDDSFAYKHMGWLHEQMVERAVGYLNHSIGLSVHDPGAQWQSEPLRPGMILAVDPMAWIEDRKHYIRIEDAVLVTEDGFDNLTEDVPMEPEAIEAFMKEDGSFTNI